MKNLFKIENGVLVDVLDRNIETAVIPDGVTSIGEDVFEECTSLTSITIPNSVTVIGDCAFRGCTSLKSITIPDSVTSIGDYAFFGTGYYIDKSNWVDNVLYIDNCLIAASHYNYFTDKILFEVSGDYNIKEGTKVIANDAFYECTGLTSVTIPEGVTNIGDNAFCNCTSLSNITIPDSVTVIGNCAFRGCRSLSSISIPDSVATIGIYAFSHCTGLANIVIGNSVTSIGDGVFRLCTSLTNVTIPKSVTSIGVGAFSGCTSLASITIPKSVTTMGDLCFYDCDALKTKSGVFKAFNLRKDGTLSCQGYHFEVGEWAKTEFDIKLCRNGYHFCTNLFEIFNYYYGRLDEDIAIFECEVGDEVVKGDTNSKCVTNTIKPVKRLYSEDVVKLLSM